MAEKMEEHTLLLHQLNRLKLNTQMPPINQLGWQSFLKRINQAYIEAEKERYLLERSMEISNKEMNELNEKLLDSARRAGMADVATTILHNVGNVLNSANVSIGILQETFSKTHTKKIELVAELLKENKENLFVFLQEDPKGRALPDYIIKLSDSIKKEISQALNEIVFLNEQINHIREIVAMQNVFSNSFGFKENVSILELIEKSIQMAGNDFESNQINFIKKINNTFPKIAIDKSKFTQILVNILQNAKEALLESKETKKRILTIELIKTNDENCEIHVSDNGIGISNENKTKIFSMGFTTKKNGHGFGLHSSAIAAKELGGSLQVKSDGINQGTTFILSIPINYSLESRYGAI